MASGFLLRRCNQPLTTLTSLRHTMTPDAARLCLAKARFTPPKVSQASNQSKRLSFGSNRVQPAVSAQATNISDNSPVPSSASKQAASAPWFGKPTRPGPDLEDGADCHDFLGLNKLTHTCASLASGVMFLALGATLTCLVYLAECTEWHEGAVLVWWDNLQSSLLSVALIICFTRPVWTRSLHGIAVHLYTCRVTMALI